MKSNGRLIPNHILTGAAVVVLALLSVSPRAIAQTYVFNQGSFQAGTNPGWIAVGDFNGDGKSDLAVVNNGGDSISILLGKPDGTFEPHVDYSTGYGTFPGSIAVGDFNGDGIPDLAVTLWQANAVAIFLGNGDGTFQAPVNYDLGENAQVVTVGDFNGDGKLDLAVTKTMSFNGDVAILLGNGDGTFQPHVDYPASNAPVWLAAADLNGDGKLDLLVATGYSDAVSVYLGNGDGTFKPYVNYPANAYAGTLVVADFNGDGKLDVALTGYQSGVAILLGNGNGTFQPPINYPVGGGGLAVGDFNGDGKLDLALSSGNIAILLGNGDGTFQPPVYFGAGAPDFLTTGDFNGDGKLDLAVVDNFGNPTTSIRILLGNGDGSFATKSGAYATGNEPFSVVAEDLNGDGKPDLVITNSLDNTVSILLNSGGGKYLPKVDYAVAGSPVAAVVGDFNKDGKMDLAVASQNCATYPCGTGLVSILLGNGDGTFQAHSDYAVGKIPNSIALGDFNNDGNLDLAVANGADNTVSILLGAGNGSFLAAKNTPTATGPLGVAVGDLNGDGKLDMVISSPAGVSVFLGNGDGSFQPRVDYSLSGSTTANNIALGDFNSDGRLDVVMVRGGTISVFLGNGDGTLQANVDTWFVGAIAISALTVRDFNGDGKLDAAFINQGNVEIALGKGDGTFNSPLEYNASSNPFTLGAADLDGDGSIDLAVGNWQTDTVSVLLNKPVMAMNPPALSFGNQVVGTTAAARSVQIFNPGSAPITYSNISATGDFAATNNCSPTLAIGGNCAVSVTFTPAAIGPQSQMLTITYDAPSSPQAIALSGTGFNGAGVLLSPASLSFANQEVTTTSAAETITLTNNGNAALTITKIATTGDFAQTNTCTGSIAAGDNCVISVTFTPSVIGKRFGKITISDNAWDSPQTASLAGKGVGPLISLSPSSLNFGNQVFAATSAAQTVTINNLGHSPLSVTGINVTGDFGQTNTCSAPVAAGATCTISVTFTPSVSGASAGSLTVVSNASNSPNTIALTGNGISAVISVNWPSLYFGNQLVGITSAAQTVTVSNYGEVPLIITSIPITGNFNQTNTCSPSVPPQGYCNVNVTFTPSAIGPASGTLTFVDNAPGPSPVVSLSGTGTSSYSAPRVYQIVPPEAVAGAPAFTLTVDGSSFGPLSVVTWNGSLRTTTFINGGQLTAAILASDVTTVGTSVVSVVNPAPGGASTYPGGFDVITPSPTLTFSKTDFAVGQLPEYVAMGDFNGDGKPDLAVPNYRDETVSILLGNGDGTFRTPVAYATTGLGPVAAITGDFNHDGKLDLAIANTGCPPQGGICSQGSVSVFLGNGDGTFGQPVSVFINIITNSLAIGDFNGDGRLDLAVGAFGYSGGEVDIYLGNGDGTFQAGATYPVGDQFSQPPGSIVVADFNGDGKLDLATANWYGSDNISILIGNGDGTFQSQVQYPTGKSPYAIALADFNGDGKMDLAVANDDQTANSVSVLIGNGDGTFQTHVDYGTGVGPDSVTVGDFNGDGKLDLATSDPASNTVSILLGNGDGTFQANQDFVVGVAPVSIVANDFNGDGALDLAVANAGSNTISVLLQVPAVLLSNPSVSFGNQALGATSAPQSITLKNTGTPPLAISSIAIAGANAGDFAQTNTCGTSVAGGASCTINVTFTPTILAAETGTLAITDNAAGSPQTVALSGTGIASIAGLSAPSLSFGNQNVGTTSAAQTVTLTNSGNAPLNITSLSVGGANSGNFIETNNCGTSVAGGASCMINVTFTPTIIGAEAGTLTITDNAAGSPQTVALSGTGMGSAVSLSPASLTFAAQLDASSSAAQAITLANTGNAALAVTGIAATGDFGETNTCGASVAASASCTISVTFKPTIAGARTGALTINDNAGGGPQTAALAGTGADFTTVAASGSSTIATVTSGGTATYTLSLSGTQGFAGTATLKCADPASLSSCTVNPASLSLSGTTAVNATVTVTTTARSMVGPQSFNRPPTLQVLPAFFPMWAQGNARLVLSCLALVLMLGMLGVAARRRKQVRAQVSVAARVGLPPSTTCYMPPTALAPLWVGLASAVLFVAMLAALSMPACGGGGGTAPPGGNPGTPSGTYTLSVTATVASGAATLTHKTNLTLTVN